MTAGLEAKLKLLRPKPGDLVVIELPGDATTAVAEEARHVVSLGCPDGTTVVTARGIRVTSISRADWRRIIAEAP